MAPTYPGGIAIPHWRAGFRRRRHDATRTGAEANRVSGAVLWKSEHRHHFLPEARRLGRVALDHDGSDGAGHYAAGGFC